MRTKKVKIIRIDKKEFELEDGRVFQHPVELETVPSLEEFQKIYDQWFRTIKGLENQDAD